MRRITSAGGQFSRVYSGAFSKELLLIRNSANAPRLLEDYPQISLPLHRGQQLLPVQKSFYKHVRWESTNSNKDQQPQKDYASQGNIIQKLSASIRQELNRNKELQENLEKLREERLKMENSESAKEARRKFEIAMHTTNKTSEYIAEQTKRLVELMKEQIEEAKKSEYGKKTLEGLSETAEVLGKAARSTGDTAVVKTVVTGMKVITEEINDVSMKHAGMYVRPEELKTRAEYFSSSHMARTVEANTEAMGIELHKDAKWSQGFKNWMDSNPAVNKFMEFKTRLDESDNVMARATRFFTDKVSSVFASNEFSEVLTEIQKVDPEFDKDEFLSFCEKVIIPNVLEALIRGDLPVFKDWCHEMVYRQVAPVIQNRPREYRSASRILDISRIELLAGKMMEQGPVLIIQFFAHYIDATVDPKGKVVAGDLEKPMKMMHIWALCRDLEELNPIAAWKVLELHQSPQEQFVM